MQGSGSGLDLVWLRRERGGNEKHLHLHLIGLIKTYAFEEYVQIKVCDSLQENDLIFN